ncbi:ferredoxin--NADP reductase [Alkalilimnicola sp. S0819]|uniref:ferredoxin--NADP reductase n=1 Tax=Alkalilimnicola sp. S0819 TaxID=2613922 RepID=UPI0012614C7C|nr:ferredoxin--NADP reductase [Alkalilimnicola sp. S0819]KAB7623950.1 ferredoxin--NADP reductase [Alkalilimnicola sp. S0819]MPQ16550.1 ferredoxin--NADP reductase [Alkalilimnicola sp. S0819]
MAALGYETVLDVHHWNDSLFSFRCTRPEELRFRNGQFLLLGLKIDGRPVMRAYSMVSTDADDHLEFFSIKLDEGQLTSRLRHLKAGDQVIVSRKPVGTLVLDDLRPGKHLYLLSTGTGLAPFMSIIRDPETYRRFDKVVLVHGVREISDLAYADYIREELPQHPQLGEQVRRQLRYYPTVTREDYPTQGRIPDLIESGRMSADLGLPELNPAQDRIMLCGSPAMLEDLCALLDRRGFEVSARTGSAGDYVVERAFVEK